ncbi:MAG: propionate CoA-transferase [Clostridiales bacterium]|nr:propionate CoA-transferase [Clostridiales bacterium]
MFRIVSAEYAVSHIKDGDCIGINAFLSLANPGALHDAISNRVEATGHPSNLTLFGSSGFGAWDESMFADRYAALGAVSKVIASHFASMPVITRLAVENKIEVYNLPLGVLSHCLRAAAGGEKGLLSRVGRNIFVDPRIDGPGVNSISREELVTVTQVAGEEYLYYKTPAIDVALIKGTTVDPNGNITFEKECLTVDALALAQATKANGGIVIVQVEGVSHVFARPRNVIVPGILVDYVVVVEDQKQLLHTDYNPTLSGDIHVPPSHMDYWLSRMKLSGKRGEKETDPAHLLIGERASKELKPGQVVNLGIGIPEVVAQCASRAGKLNEMTLTVESGGVGGLPAPGIAFGATIGADFISDTSQQFDMYNGGGLDICFMGGLEIDRYGNVNAHKLKGKFVGIGGFANITYATKTVVFCVTFNTKGLKVHTEDGKLVIDSEGSISKFKREIEAISFSAKNALETGQNVLYVTERCVFKLTEKGLKLIEITPGAELQRDILSRLDFVPEL